MGKGKTKSQHEESIIMFRKEPNQMINLMEYNHYKERWEVKYKSVSMAFRLDLSFVPPHLCKLEFALLFHQSLHRKLGNVRVQLASRFHLAVNSLHLKLSLHCPGTSAI